MSVPKRILVIKPSSLGDIVQSVPVVSELHQNHPDSEIRWIIQPDFCSLVEHHPGVSGTILFPRNQFRGWRGFLRSTVWIKTLTAWKPDLAIDLQGLLRSALFAKASGAERIIGLSDAREGATLFYTTEVKVDSHNHAVMRYLSVLQEFGISLPKEPRFIFPSGQAIEGFNTSVPYIVLHPYARGHGKSLNNAQVRAFIHGAYDRRVVIVGRGQGMTHLSSNSEDWSNRTTLLELIHILRHASLIISSDSGPMHLAAALQPSRTIGIYLWSDPLKVGPFSPEAKVWKNGSLIYVSQLDDSYRGHGRAPTEYEMESLGYLSRRSFSFDASR